MRTQIETRVFFRSVIAAAFLVLASGAALAAPMRIEAVITPKADSKLEFEDGSMRSNGSISIEPQNEAVRVIWVNQGDLGKNPVNRYFGLWIDSMLGSQLEQGLSNLQRRAEQGAK